MTEFAPDVATACTALQKTVKIRQLAVLQAAAGKLDWEALPELSDDPLPGLFESVKRLIEQAKALEATPARPGLPGI